MAVRVRLLAATATLLLAAACTPSTPSADREQGTAVGPPANGQRIGFDEGRSQPVADPVYPQYGNPAIDVLHYDLKLDWAPPTKTLTGIAELAIRATKPVTEIALDFAPTYALTRVSVDGRTVNATRRGEKLVIPAAVAADAKVLARVEYRGTPKEVRFPSSRADAEEGIGLRPTPDGAAWTMQEPYGAFTWYPCTDQPSDEATYDMALTAPPGWTGVATGKFEGRSGNTTRFASKDPVATYVTTVAFGKYKLTTDAGPRGTPVNYWTRPGVDDELLPLLRKAPAHLAWLESKFGPYPFANAGFVVVPSESAMETQELVTIGSAMAASQPPEERALEFESVSLHELAHQWFGDSVTPKDWRGVWINEGWATYAQGLYEISQGQTTAAEWEERTRRGDARSRASAGPPGGFDPRNFAELNVYVGPALMLRQIHQAIGDAAFFALGRDWVQTQRNSQQDRASFTAFVNKRTGRDFTALINTWLDSKSTPL